MMRKFLPVFLILLLLAVKPVFAKGTCQEDCLDDGNTAEYCRNLCGNLDFDYGSGGSGPIFNPTLNDYRENTYDQPVGSINDTSWAARFYSTLVNKGGDMTMGVPGNKASTQTSAVRALAGGVDLLLKTRPASSYDYVAYMGSRLKVPGTPDVAYAATFAPGGVGFVSLGPVLQIWTIVRNLAYLIFAIVFVIVGLMIMFRVKIDPKTAANIQNALPKIIMALIVVTFSYAIAGLLVDIMFVALGLIVAITGAVSSDFAKTTTDILNGSIFRILGTGEFWGSAWGAGGAIDNIVQNFLYVQSKIPIAEQGGQLIGFLSHSLVFLIIAIAILVALFKTWLVLLGAYANIILGIIFAPVQLMLDAIPGQNQFTGWVKNMIANLATFPAVLIMVSLGSLLATNFGKLAPDSAGTGFVPPLIGGNSQSAIQGLIGVGIILTIPKTLDIIRELIKAPAFKYGTAFMEPLKPATNTAKWAGAQGYGRYYEREGGPGEKAIAHQYYKEQELKNRALGDKAAPPPEPQPGTRPEKLGIFTRIQAGIKSRWK